MRRILLTGAGGAASQNFLASLRLADEPYYVVGTDANPYHLASAQVDSPYELPRCSDPGYLDALRKIAAAERIELIHPQPDPEVAFLSAHRGEIPVPLFLPADGTIRQCHDKARCNDVLQAAGVPVPTSYRVADRDDLPEMVARLRKLHSSIWVRAVRGAGSRAALPVETARQASDWIHYWETAKGLQAADFMLAEYLPGREFAFQSLWYEGELITSMARERLEYIFGNLMPSGQSSSPSIARTVHRRDVNDIGMRAVRAVSERPHGVFCVDMKENGRGTPAVTEINAGRFFTTSNFFAEAGSNMPHYYVKLALGESLPELPKVDAVASDLYWVRGVDRLPTLIGEEAWKPLRLAS